MPKRVSTVAVDFDGVIHAYSKGWHDGTIYDGPVPGALAALHELMRHYAVFVHTTRNRRKVASWIEQRTGYGIECVTSPWPSQRSRRFWTTQNCLLVTNKKLPAVAYIDDRGIRFESWPQALAALRGGEQK